MAEMAGTSSPADRGERCQEDHAPVLDSESRKRPWAAAADGLSAKRRQDGFCDPWSCSALPNQNPAASVRRALALQKYAAIKRHAAALSGNADPGSCTSDDDDGGDQTGPPPPPPQVAPTLFESRNASVRLLRAFLLRRRAERRARAAAATPPPPAIDGATPPPSLASIFREVFGPEYPADSTCSRARRARAPMLTVVAGGRRCRAMMQSATWRRDRRRRGRSGAAARGAGRWPSARPPGPRQ